MPSSPIRGVRGRLALQVHVQRLLVQKLVATHRTAEERTPIVFQRVPFEGQARRKPLQARGARKVARSVRGAVHS